MSATALQPGRQKRKKENEAWWKMKRGHVLRAGKHWQEWESKTRAPGEVPVSRAHLAHGGWFLNKQVIGDRRREQARHGTGPLGDGGCRKGKNSWPWGFWGWGGKMHRTLHGAADVPGAEREEHKRCPRPHAPGDTTAGHRYPFPLCQPGSTVMVVRVEGVPSRSERGWEKPLTRRREEAWAPAQPYLGLSKKPRADLSAPRASTSPPGERGLGLHVP